MILSLGPLYLSMQSLSQPLGGWVYVLLSILVAVEGPIITLAAAVAASAGLLDPWLVFAFASLGNLTADTLWYGVGYMGKTEWLLQHASWLGIKESFLTRLQQDIHQHVNKVLFIAKLTLGFVIPTLIAAGLARVPLRRWFGTLFTAECIWTGGLILLGYYFGYLVQRIETSLGWISLGGAVLFVVLTAAYLLHLKQEMESKP